MIYEVIVAFLALFYTSPLESCGPTPVCSLVPTLKIKPRLNFWTSGFA